MLLSAGCLFNIPQPLLLHEGQAWEDADYGKAFRLLKVIHGCHEEQVSCFK